MTPLLMSPVTIAPTGVQFATTYMVCVLTSITGVLVMPTTCEYVSVQTPDFDEEHRLRFQIGATVDAGVRSFASNAYRLFFDVVTTNRSFTPLAVFAPFMN